MKSHNKIEIMTKKQKKERKNVNAHNYGQWIGVEKDLSVIEPHTIYFVNITVMKK